MKKSTLFSIFLSMFLLVLLGYYLWNYTSLRETVESLLAGPPRVSDLDESFPNDKSTYLGEFETSYFPDGKAYGFLVNKKGIDSLYFLPSDFNTQDVNKRTYLYIPKGDPVDLATEGLIFIQDEILQQRERSVDFTTVHKVHYVSGGVEQESLPLMYKLKYLDGEEDNYNYFFYMNTGETIEPRESSSELETF